MSHAGEGCVHQTEGESGVTDAEMIASLAGKLTPEELQALASRLKRKSKQEIKPTSDEEEQFERLWRVRKQFTKRPGDPKRPALLKFCQRIREKPAPIEAIEYGIRCEYGAKKDRPELYCQMLTFMSQRRWENYDYAAVKAHQQRSANVVSISAPKSKWLQQFEAEKQQKQA